MDYFLKCIRWIPGEISNYTCLLYTSKQKDAYEIEKMNHGEFDYMIHFVNSKDKYLYCFKDEGCHIIYHRFLPEDYEDLGL